METIRTLSRNEVDILLDWAADEGWNPGHDDAAAFHATDPNGFIGAFVDDSLVAGISVIAYGTQDGFLGLYLCHPDYRGQGHGWRVWQAGMQYLEGRSIGLDGVVDQQANYRRSGFELIYRNIRYEGTPEDRECTMPPSFEIRPLGPSDIAEVTRFDAAVHGIDRQSFIAHWLDGQADSRQSIVVLRDGDIEGFGTIRRCRQQYKVGPLLIDTAKHNNTETTATIATTMINTLVASVGAHTITLDIPEPNKCAAAVAQQLSLKPVFETARMYRGRTPDIKVQNIYGVSTLELG